MPLCVEIQPPLGLLLNKSVQITLPSIGITVNYDISDSTRVTFFLMRPDFFFKTSLFDSAVVITYN